MSILSPNNLTLFYEENVCLSSELVEAHKNLKNYDTNQLRTSTFFRVPLKVVLSSPLCLTYYDHQQDIDKVICRLPYSRQTGSGTDRPPRPYKEHSMCDIVSGAVKCDMRFLK